jgi:hypothetical protein
VAHGTGKPVKKVPFKTGASISDTFHFEIIGYALAAVYSNLASLIKGE